MPLAISLLLLLWLLAGAGWGAHRIAAFLFAVTPAGLCPAKLSLRHALMVVVVELARGDGRRWEE